MGIVGAGIGGARGWDLSTLAHFSFVGNDVHLHLPRDGDHFLPCGWLFPPDASLNILGLHFGKSLFAEEDEDVFAEDQR